MNKVILIFACFALLISCTVKPSKFFYGTVTDIKIVKTDVFQNFDKYMLNPTYEIKTDAGIYVVDSINMYNFPTIGSKLYGFLESGKSAVQTKYVFEK